MLEVGQEAPDFTLPDADGEEVTLSAFRPNPVLVYFYPADETPGCTTQAQGIRDRWEEFTSRGVAVVGISPDSVASHASFRENHALPHVLLSDPDKTVMEPWGAWGEKTLYGRTSVGVIRSSVLLDGDGVVVKVWKRAQAKVHAERALAAVDELLGSG